MKISTTFTLTPSTMGIQSRVKQFIISAARFEDISWPGYPVTIFISDQPKGVSGGTWEINGNTIYVGQRGHYGNDIPLWAVGALFVIAQTFQLHEDEEIKEALKLMFAKIIAGAIDPLNVPLVSTTSNKQLSSLAVHKVNKTLVGEVEPNVWALPNGEPIEVDDEDWIKIELP